MSELKTRQQLAGSFHVHTDDCPPGAFDIALNQMVRYEIEPADRFLVFRAEPHIDELGTGEDLGIPAIVRGRDRISVQPGVLVKPI